MTRIPPTSGAIRFRLTPDASAASFERGTDLMQPHRSVPWSLSLFTLADSKIGAGFLSLAQKDGLITPDLITHCRELTNGKRGRGGILSHYLFALEQPFFLDLSVQPLLLIVGPDHIKAAQFALARDWVYDSSSQTHKFFQAYSGDIVWHDLNVRLHQRMRDDASL
ncbi:hypothetical protein Hypma_000048 [Hypsizygus marmoreus]|uniref:Uncharacterized protein n=1 Tax=Hypsizygus marmoreus TaxID=39966 RepID=A0A369K940_HYPMA|nr:hypothetical protein Hypma_000048 [Hypsizygus marmoreus]